MCRCSKLLYHILITTRKFRPLNHGILDLPVPQFAFISAGAVSALVVTVQILLTTIVPGQSYVKAEHGTMDRFLGEYVRVIRESHSRPCGTVKFESSLLQLKGSRLRE